MNAEQAYSELIKVAAELVRHDGFCYPDSQLVISEMWEKATNQGNRIKRVADYMRTALKELDRRLQESDDFAHLIVKEGIIPGKWESDCRCDQCRRVAVLMDEAGYLNRVSDRWWEQGA